MINRAHLSSLHGCKTRLIGINEGASAIRSALFPLARAFPLAIRRSRLRCLATSPSAAT